MRLKAVNSMKWIGNTFAHSRVGWCAAVASVEIQVRKAAEPVFENAVTDILQRR
jgi:hypothetical protein